MISTLLLALFLTHPTLAESENGSSETALAVIAEEEQAMAVEQPETPAPQANAALLPHGLNRATVSKLSANDASEVKRLLSKMRKDPRWYAYKLETKGIFLNRWLLLNHWKRGIYRGFVQALSEVALARAPQRAKQDIISEGDEDLAESQALVKYLHANESSQIAAINSEIQSLETHRSILDQLKSISRRRVKYDGMPLQRRKEKLGSLVRMFEDAYFEFEHSSNAIVAVQKLEKVWNIWEEAQLVTMGTSSPKLTKKQALDAAIPTAGGAGLGAAGGLAFSVGLAPEFAFFAGLAGAIFGIGKTVSKAVRDDAWEAQQELFREYFTSVLEERGLNFSALEGLVRDVEKGQIADWQRALAACEASAT